MIDFSTLQTKVNDLKAKVAINSITPYYLGALLDDFISQMKSLDLSDDFNAALDNMRTSITEAAQSAKDANDAAAAVQSALDTAVTELEAEIQALADSAGQPGGLATLDADGTLNETQVPAFLSDGVRAGATARFFGIVNGQVTVEQTGSTSTGMGSVVYLAKNKIFAWQAGGKYYSAWNSAAYPMVMYNDGLSVRKNKLFLYGQNAYVWSDEDEALVELAGMKADANMFVTISESEYAALATKDNDTYYFIYE